MSGAGVDSGLDGDCTGAAHLVIAQHHGASIDFIPPRRVRTVYEEVCLQTSVFFFGALSLALLYGFNGTYNSRTSSNRSKNAQDHDQWWTMGSAGMFGGVSEAQSD
jgi:hypothetical protein